MQLYDVDESVVLKYLPQSAVHGSTVPGADEIKSTGEFLNTACAEVHDALIQGGFEADAETALATSSSNIAAYWIIHKAIARRAAIHYSNSVSHLFADNSLAEALKASDKQLEEFSSGNSIGELSVAGGKQTAVFYHGDDDIDDINEMRAKFEDPL